jgi:pimeloyl-ACP methyl ester carboxylesterase
MSSLVLIPGLLCDRRLWSAQIEVLASYADIAVADITQQSTISDMAAAILAKSPEHFSLVGFSLGSQVALEIMRLSKERVERLALLSATHGGLLPAADAAIRRAVEVIQRESLDRYLEDAYPTYVAPRRVDDESLKRIFVEMANNVGKAAGLRQMQALLAIKTPFMDLDQIHCPTVIVGGRKDRRTTPAAHRLLQQEIRGSELVIIDDAGHFTPIEQPQAVTEILQHCMDLGNL